MSKIDNYLAFVKEQVAVQHRLAKRYEAIPVKKNRHLDSSRNFAELAEFLEEIHSKGTHDTSYLNRGNSARKKLLLTYEEIDGAPEELLKELNLTEADRRDLMTEYLIAKAGGIMSLDQIMLQMWKRTGEVPKRNTLVSRLYRMVSPKGMIFNVPGKKGVYSTYEITDDDAKKLFGVDGEVEEPTQAAPAATANEPPTAAPQTKSMFPRRLADSKYASSTSAGAINRRT